MSQDSFELESIGELSVISMEDTVSFHYCCEDSNSPVVMTLSGNPSIKVDEPGIRKYRQAKVRVIIEPVESTQLY